MQKELDARYRTWEEFSHDLAQSFRNKRLARRSQEVPDSEKFEALRGLIFFREFSDVELWEVVRFSRWNESVPGTVIMKDGERGDFFAFLLGGELIVSKKGVVLGTLAVGECFGEMAVIRRDEHTRGADVVVRATARVVTVSAQTLQHASEACRMHFYQSFLDVISGRLADANSRLAALELWGSNTLKP
jgi:CRP-like cAMP-binding protein